MNNESRTIGEGEFEKYLTTAGYPFEYEKVWPGKKRRPDYMLTRGGGTFLFDVKDFDPRCRYRVLARSKCILESDDKLRRDGRNLRSSKTSLAVWRYGTTAVCLRELTVRTRFLEPCTMMPVLLSPYV